jgi:hypothetical protein
MDIDPSHPVSVLGQFGDSRHLLGGRTAGPIAHGLSLLLLVALEAANCSGWIGCNLHGDLLISFYPQ